MQDVNEQVDLLPLLFPSREQKKSKIENFSEDIPEEYQIHDTLCSLFKGDIQKMEWFYENKTKADLMLMVLIHNYRQGYDYE